MSSKYPVLSEALTKRYALPEADADKFVAQMFDVLLKAVEQEGVVKVKGLGTFKLTPVGARESVDVNTGERIVIDSRNKITFVPDVVLRDRVNSPLAEKMSATVSANRRLLLRQSWHTTTAISSRCAKFFFR